MMRAGVTCYERRIDETHMNIDRRNAKCSVTDTKGVIALHYPNLLVWHRKYHRHNHSAIYRISQSYMLSSLISDHHHN